jgi:hypothetical protein
MVYRLASWELGSLNVMEIIRVDPRDETWDVWAPRYRVYFWAGTASDEYEIADADVGQVIEWAEGERGNRTYTLYVCVEKDGLGLVRLAGADPTHIG